MRKNEEKMCMIFNFYLIHHTQVHLIMEAKPNHNAPDTDEQQNNAVNNIIFSWAFLTGIHNLFYERMKQSVAILDTLKVQKMYRHFNSGNMEIDEDRRNAYKGLLMLEYNYDEKKINTVIYCQCIQKVVWTIIDITKYPFEAHVTLQHKDKKLTGIRAQDIIFVDPNANKSRLNKKRSSDSSEHNVIRKSSRLNINSNQELEKKGDDYFVIDKIIDKRTKKGNVEYRVKWKNYPVKEASWSLEADLIQDDCQSIIDEYEGQVSNDLA